MGAADQRVRENPYVDDIAKTLRTVAYKESTPLDNTHLLVAQVNISTATALPLPAGGWVERGTGGANGANQMRTYVKQGDGVTNSITIESAEAFATVHLSAYAGYNGLTPILVGGGSAGSGTVVAFSGISGQAGDGVALLGAGLITAPAGWGGWSAGTPTPALADQPATARGWWAAVDYVNGSGAANTNVTWGGSRSIRFIALVMPLVSVVTNSAVSTLPPLSQSAQATVTDPGATPVTADAVSTLPSLSQSASATVTDPSADPTGSIVSTLPPMSQSATATVTNPTQPSGTTTPTRSQMPAAPFDLYPAPTYSWGAGSAPSGAGYTTIAPDSSLVKLLGAARKGTQAGSVSGFVNPAPLQDIAGAGTGTNPLVYPAFGKRILTNSPEVWFKVAQRSYSGFSNISARAAMRPRVNRKWTSMMPTYAGSTIGFPSNPESITAGEYWMKMTFPDSQLREIELNDHLEFGGVVIPSAYTFSTPSAAEHVLVVLDGSLGAAEKHQTGNFSLSGSEGSGAAASYTAVTSYVWALAQILGYDSVVNVGAGSSGFSISGDTASWKSSNKVPVDVLEHLGDLNLVGSANNDQAAGQSTAQVDTASNTVYGLVAAGAKSTAINVAVGMFTPPAAGSQSTVEASVAPYNTVLKARAQQNGFYFINPTTGQFYDPQGNLLLTTSNWVYQDLGDISSDNTHPTQRGANNMGTKMATALKLAHVDDTATPVVSAAIASVLPPLKQSATASTGSGTITPASFGPTGLHWPDNTPRLTDVFGYDVECAPTWTAIANAINNANTPANLSKVAVVRVTPGNLLGNGAGATSTPVLQNIGVVDRPGGRILIIPRDGVGSVDASSKSLRFLDVRGTSFIGFNTWQFGQAQVDGSGVLVSGCKDFAYGWAKARFWNIGNRSDVVLDRVQFVELVANESFLYPEPDAEGKGSGAADRIQWYNSTSIDGSASGASGTANKPEIIGCFSAPVRVWQWDDAHLDGLQIYGTGTFTDVLMKDTVLYAASHQGFISSEIANIILDHSLLIGGDTANDTQFPLEPNAATPENAGAPWPVNGAPSSAVAKNGTKLYGSPKTWPLQYDSTSGQESRTSLAFLNENAPVPTDARLQQMWSFTAAPADPTGSITSTLPPMSQSAVATVTDPVSAAITSTLPAMSQSAQATVTDADILANALSTLPSMTQTAQMSAQEPGLDRTAIGGLEIGGTALLGPLIYRRLADGGIELGGSAAVLLEIARTATGGIVIGGFVTKPGGEGADLASLEMIYYTFLGLTGSLEDRREQFYGPAGEWAYWAARSGLTPAGRYSLSDHKSTVARAATNSGPQLSLSDLMNRFYRQ